MSSLRVDLEALAHEYEGDQVSRRIRSILATHAPKLKKEERIRFDFDAVMWRGITRADLSRWAEAFPAVDIERQLKAMKVWIINAGAKGHKMKWGSFITRWLSRSQDKGVA